MVSGVILVIIGVLFGGNAFLTSPSSSLLHFVHKTSKNRLIGGFLPYKLRKEPIYRGFYGFFAKKNHKNLQVQQAPSAPQQTVQYLGFVCAAIFIVGGLILIRLGGFSGDIKERLKKQDRVTEGANANLSVSARLTTLI
ncbi:MAG: hypothetical protein LBQ67_05165 [Treponema sp.]|jgi:hypothetical protein|nr:hypothetical protein [Treponema sp.]